MENQLNEIEITSDDFEAYEQVRMSGVTNMFNVGNVEMLSGLNRKKILFIMQNYDEFSEKYG